MRSTVVNDPKLLGRYHDSSYQLRLGSEQSMVFSADDEGPCYLNIDGRVTKRYDIVNGKEKTKTHKSRAFTTVERLWNAESTEHYIKTM